MMLIVDTQPFEVLISYQHNFVLINIKDKFDNLGQHYVDDTSANQRSAVPPKVKLHPSGIDDQ